MLTQEPTATAVVAALVAISLAAGSLASIVFLRSSIGGTRASASAARPRALRRGVEVGIVAGAVAALQVAGGLTPLTALFVVLAFAIMEYVLSAGRSAPR
ncbi:MAG TPA: hypothetical protein VM690_00705 [Gaiellaceae bacterium]|nr:hypothetical protein [Gaiellaceae bacterium]